MTTSEDTGSPAGHTRDGGVLIGREPDSADKRFTLVAVTAGGLALVTKAAPVHVGNVRHLIFDVLDETEQHALRRALMKILSNLTEGS